MLKIINMITTVYTIEEINFKNNNEDSRKLLRFRDKGTRDKYLKNVTMKHYVTLVESGIVKPSTYDLSKKSKLQAMFDFEHEDGVQEFRIKIGVEDIEIIEALASDDKQMKLEL